jgi:hypothetical protein
MEARKKRTPAKKTKRKPGSRSVLEVKQILDQKIKLYAEKESGRPSMAQEPEVVYGKPKPVDHKSAASNKKIVKRLKALKELVGIYAGLWPMEDAQEYVNRLRSNDR